jgi:hypothetical protein
VTLFPQIFEAVGKGGSMIAFTTSDVGLCDWLTTTPLGPAEMLITRFSCIPIGRPHYFLARAGLTMDDGVIGALGALDSARDRHLGRHVTGLAVAHFRLAHWKKSPTREAVVGSAGGSPVVLPPQMSPVGKSGQEVALADPANGTCPPNLAHPAQKLGSIDATRFAREIPNANHVSFNSSTRTTTLMPSHFILASQTTQLASLRFLLSPTF